MVLYVLDENLDYVGIVENYISLIWTERWSEAGEFELEVPLTYDTFSLLQRNRYLVAKQFEDTMIIETVEIKDDTTEGKYLSLTGRSLLSILDRRVIAERSWFVETSAEGDKVDSYFEFGQEHDFNTWECNLVTNQCIEPTVKDRIIPNVVVERHPEITVMSHIIITDFNTTVYDALVKGAQNIGYGIKMVLNDKKQFVFSVREGTDRSSKQTKVNRICFSPEFYNLLYTNYFESGKTEKNAIYGIGAYIYISYKSQLVQVPGSDPSTYTPDPLFHSGEYWSYTDNESKTGLSRKEMAIDLRRSIDKPTFKQLVESSSSNGTSTKSVETIEWQTDSSIVATNIDSSIEVENANETEFNSYIQSCAIYLEGELSQSEYKTTQTAEGTVDNLGQYILGRDYWMGDKVELSNEYGLEMNCVIDEIVTSFDSSGVTITPNFSQV